MIYAAVGGLAGLGAPVVYSVTLESGSKLGGKSQAPKENAKKSVPTPDVPQPKKKEEPEPEPEVEDAEVSIPKEKPTPKEKPKPTPKKEKPKPTPKKEKPKEKPKVKPKPKPKPKATPKRKSINDIDKALERAVKKYAGESTNAGGEGYGSTGAGGRGYGGGELRPPEFFRYRDILESHIKSGWRWHDPNSSLRAAVCFSLSETGQLSSIRLCSSSRDQKFDGSVTRAVQKANPVPPPPPSVYRQYFRSVRITFTPQGY